MRFAALLLSAAGILFANSLSVTLASMAIQLDENAAPVVEQGPASSPVPQAPTSTSGETEEPAPPVTEAQPATDTATQEPSTEDAGTDAASKPPTDSDTFGPDTSAEPLDQVPGFSADTDQLPDGVRNQGVDSMIGATPDVHELSELAETIQTRGLEKQIQKTTEAATELRDILKQIVDLQAQIDPNTAAAAAPAAAAATPTPAGSVYLLSVADTNDAVLRIGAQQNVLAINKLVTDQCAAVGGTTVVTSQLTGTSFNLNQLRATCNQLSSRVTANDTVFLYLSAHGAYSGTGANAQQFFTMPGGTAGGPNVLRRDIWNLIKGLGARQTILISDSCSLQSSGVTANAALGTTAQSAVAGIDPKGLGLLLVYQSGDFDLNASTRAPTDNGSGNSRAAGRGQFAIYPGDGGPALFTRSFVSAANSMTATQVSWRMLLNQTQSNLNAQFGNGISTNTPFGLLNLRRQNLEYIP